MRFAISIPQFVSDGEFDPARFRAYMARAQALGFDLGGHLKTGQLWTGQNRPVREWSQA
jgi:hypothetical protein